MRATEALIAWSYNGEVEVGPWPDTTGWSKRYGSTGGACWSWYHLDPPRDAVAADLLRTMTTMVCHYGVPLRAAMSELLKIDEFHSDREAADTWRLREWLG